MKPSPEAIRIADALRKMKTGGSADNRPKGLPSSAENSDSGTEVGTFEQEGLTDPGIQNEVTGNGGGPVMGGGKARATRSGCGCC